jgi:hypothetical protein
LKGNFHERFLGEGSSGDAAPLPDKMAIGRHSISQKDQTQLRGGNARKGRIMSGKHLFIQEQAETQVARFAAESASL